MDPSERSAADQARIDQARLDQAGLDPARLDQVRTDRARSDQGRDQARIDQARKDQAEVDAADVKAGAKPAPDLTESVRQVNAAGRASLSAAKDAAKAFRTLVTADISLARSAFGRTLALTGVAIAFGASAWLLLMATLIVFLNARLGWAWAGAMLSTALLSLAVTGVAAWQGMRYFEHTRLQATRRQLARLGIGELADFTPEAGSAASVRDVTENAPPEAADGKPVKDERGIDVTPP